MTKFPFFLFEIGTKYIIIALENFDTTHRVINLVRQISITRYIHRLEQEREN